MAVTVGIWSPSIAAVFNNQDPADKNDSKGNQEYDTRVGAATCQGSGHERRQGASADARPDRIDIGIEATAATPQPPDQHCQQNYHHRGAEQSQLG
ncbi:MAG: hypothetical protein E5Y16_34095, partial [Mesorhizobium sp.]